MNVERVREVIQQLQKPISRMNAASQNSNFRKDLFIPSSCSTSLKNKMNSFVLDKKRKRSEEQDEEISTPFLKFQKSSEE